MDFVEFKQATMHGTWWEWRFIQHAVDLTLGYGFIGWLHVQIRCRMGYVSPTIHYIFVYIYTYTYTYILQENLLIYVYIHTQLCLKIGCMSKITNGSNGAPYFQTNQADCVSWLSMIALNILSHPFDLDFPGSSTRIHGTLKGPF
jgi:hypothetical protein